jgi:outer membrane murein-binding lipoprotein Lpp
MSFLSDLVPAIATGAGYMMGGPAGGALMAGGLGYLGGMQTNQSNQDIAASNSAFNAQQAQLNRDFQAQQVNEAEQYQTEMSNTSYQRSVKDMMAAGLNPMLAYMKGGASTPSISPASGSTAQAQGAVMQNPVSAAASAARDVSSASQASASVNQIDATVDKIKAETENLPDEGRRLRATVWLLKEQADTAYQKGQTEVEVRKQIAATIDKLRKETKLMDFDVQAAESLDNIGRTSKEMKPIVDMIRSFFPTYHR